MKPDADTLKRLYVDERVSPEVIGQTYGYHGRTIRKWLGEAGIPRMGPSHLRKGVCATWNVGIVRTAEQVEKNRTAKLGNIPHNKGSGNVTFICRNCGVTTSDKPYRRSSYCSALCRDTSEGEARFNFKAKAPSNQQRKRQWISYKRWRRGVMERDNFTCLHCGSHKKLTAHHLNSWATHPTERLSIQNGATLCWPCHSDFHKHVGGAKCTAEQFCEWVTASK